MDYCKDILGRLLDIYEKKGAFDKEPSSLRAIQLELKKVYPAYIDRYNYDTYKEINVAIEKLCTDGVILAEPDNSGKYSKIKLNAYSIEECYKKLKRMSIPEQCNKVKKVLVRYMDSELPLLCMVIKNWLELLQEYKKLPYDLKYNSERVEDVLNAIQMIIKLDKETYIRNLSTALFKDSKRFQKEFKGTVESILFDYTDEVVEKDNILGFYNLYENPTYVLIKGNAVIQFESSMIDVEEMPDGIALSNSSLDKIKSITVKDSKVITVENLTTYHDSNEKNAVHIYLGGYHNHSKQTLLEKIYADNKNCDYLHKGDLDVYGFLILENLKEKTGIPFAPLMMEVATIERFYHAGIYKELTETDIKIIKEKKNTKLIAYADVLQFMIDNNCKVEQESIKAVELRE